MTAWLFTRTNPAIFVIMSGVVLFSWGEIFSLFPSTLTDTYGPGHATTNYGFLYIAQGVGSVLGGPVAALVHDAFRFRATRLLTNAHRKFEVENIWLPD